MPARAERGPTFHESNWHEDTGRSFPPPIRCAQDPWLGDELPGPKPIARLCSKTESPSIQPNLLSPAESMADVPAGPRELLLYNRRKLGAERLTIVMAAPRPRLTHKINHDR